MESTTMCECCEKRPAEHTGTFTTARDCGEVRWCDVCDNAVPLTTLCDRIRSNRRRSRPAAELEALEFVAPRDFTISGRLGRNHESEHPCHHDEKFRQGDLVRFRPDSYGIEPNCWATTLCWHSDDVPRIHAELCQLRNTPAPQADSEKCQPEANPLRHLAEAFRSLTDAKFCVDCGRTCAAWRMYDEKRCCYCGLRARRAKLPEKWRPAEQGPGLDARIASATPKEAERHPSDWDVEDVEYLP